jgi:hypothetical protein
MINCSMLRIRLHACDLKALSDHFKGKKLAAGGPAAEGEPELLLLQYPSLELLSTMA